MSMVLTLDKVTTDHENIRKYALKLSIIFDMLNVTHARNEQIQNFYEKILQKLVPNSES